MLPLKIRSDSLGAGRPKIIVPLTGRTEKDILESASKLPGSPAELAEWRADFFESGTDPEACRNVLQGLREVLGALPLLFTFRTASEGGEKAVREETYRALNLSAAESGSADMIDVEVFAHPGAAELIRSLHACGAVVVGSSHNFHETPPEAEILRCLASEREAGADILKIAVMPQCREDVLTLLSATKKARETFPDRPLITMSMGKRGVLSRIAGEAFGSAATFGTLGASSAPGQIPAEKLREILTLLHTE